MGLIKPPDESGRGNWGTHRERSPMEIRFRIDQADLFRRGIDTTSSIVSLEINPAMLPEDQRELISKHLLGTDVVYDPKRAVQPDEVVPIGDDRGQID